MTSPTDSSVHAVADQLAEVYLVVGPLYRRALRHVETTAPAFGLTVGVRAVLDLLRRHGPMTVPDLGRAQDLTRQYVQRTVDAAAADGLLRTVPNPRHRRSSLVEATAPGLAAIAALERAEHERLREVAVALDPDDVGTCLAVLRQMLDALDEVERPELS